MALYQIRRGSSTFGIITKNDIVVETAPIGRWMKGKDISVIKRWCRDQLNTGIKRIQRKRKKRKKKTLA